MSKTDTVSPLRQRMIEDMAARKLNPLLRMPTTRTRPTDCAFNAIGKVTVQPRKPRNTRRLMCVLTRPVLFEASTLEQIGVVKCPVRGLESADLALRLPRRQYPRLQT